MALGADGVHGVVLIVDKLLTLQGQGVGPFHGHLQREQPQKHRSAYVHYKQAGHYFLSDLWGMGVRVGVGVGCESEGPLTGGGPGSHPSTCQHHLGLGASLKWQESPISVPS